MKKTLFILVSLIFITILVGCGNKAMAPDPVEVSELPPETPEKLIEEDSEEITDPSSNTKKDSPGYVLNGIDLHITESGTKINDKEIEGDLYVDESVGQGEFYIEDVTVKGTIYIHGGGPNSGYFINVYGKELIVESKTNPNLKLSMNTSIDGIQIASDCRVESEGNNVKAVTINNNETSQALNVLLKGNYPEVSLESTANVKINGEISLMSVLKRAELSSIDMIDTSKMYFFSSYGKSVTINGGTIVEAWINAEYCSLPADTESIQSEVGITSVTVGSKDIEIISNNTEENTLTDTPQATTENPSVPETSETSESSETVNSETTENKVSHEANPDANTNETSPVDETENSKTDEETKISETTSTEDPQEDQAATTEDTEDSEPTNQEETTSNDNIVLPLIVEGYPKVIKSMPKVTITVQANQPATLYILVEADMIFKKGSTPENVRDGISAGEGMIMGDMPYVVIHDTFNVKGTSNTETFVLNTMDYMPNNDEGPPPEGEAENDESIGVFIVFEDENGELSDLYSY